MDPLDKVKFLSYEDINNVAQKCLKEYGVESKVPVPVEHIIDNVLKINVVPFPDLFTCFDINAFTSSDRKSIYVDEYLYQNLEYQYRFTLAHELGHIALHKYIYSQANIFSIDDWKKYIAKSDPYNYKRLEFQADCFAGLFLAPRNHLEKAFDLELKKSKGDINIAKSNGLQREEYVPYIIDLISEELSGIFKVHKNVIAIRVEKDGLITKIP